jgi:hypothetical protein
MRPVLTVRALLRASVFLRSMRLVMTLTAVMRARAGSWLRSATWRASCTATSRRARTRAHPRICGRSSHVWLTFPSLSPPLQPENFLFRSRASHHLVAIDFGTSCYFAPGQARTHTHTHTHSAHASDVGAAARALPLFRSHAPPAGVHGRCGQRVLRRPRSAAPPLRPARRPVRAPARTSLRILAPSFVR